jgi:hypothetical protein
MKKAQTHLWRLKDFGRHLRLVWKETGFSLFLVRVKIVPVGGAMRILSGSPPFSDYPAQDRFYPLSSVRNTGLL